jgi:tRNA wybutosine-synthesizing protein 2
MLALKVKKEMTHDVLGRLLKMGLVDTRWRTQPSGEYVLIPLRGEPSSNELMDCEMVAYEGFSPKKSSKPVARVREILDLPEEMMSHIPFKWEMVGDVLVFKLHPILRPKREEVAGAYAEVLVAKSVFEDVGGIEDEFRVPRLERIIGEDSVTVHRENGILYKHDVSKLMFSSGNKSERMRMADIEMNDELVLDMFAGIGYFALPIAKYCNPEKVVACEKNPLALQYLRENIILNRLDNVRPMLTDCRDLNLDEKADRIIMGYFGDSQSFLEKALELIKPGGTIHYHDACPVDLLPDRPVEGIRTEASKLSRTVNVENHRVVKSYAPKVAHVVLDVVVS